MSTMPLSARLFLPVRDFGCTAVCVDAPVRLGAFATAPPKPETPKEGGDKGGKDLATLTLVRE